VSVVDRWLNGRHSRFQEGRAATVATAATLSEKHPVSAGSDVEDGLQHGATLTDPLSQAVAAELRHEKRQNSQPVEPVSQLSQVLREVFFAGWGEIEEKRGAIVEHDGSAPREVEGTLSEPTLLAPRLWFDRFGPPGEPPFDQSCVPRRGRVERQGGLFLHFCVACGAWGAFGYGVTNDRPGRWYCREHRPKDEI